MARRPCSSRVVSATSAPPAHVWHGSRSSVRTSCPHDGHTVICSSRCRRIETGYARQAHAMEMHRAARGGGARIRMRGRFGEALIEAVPQAMWPLPPSPAPKQPHTPEGVYGGTARVGTGFASSPRVETAPRRGTMHRVPWWKTWGYVDLLSVVVWGETGCIAVLSPRCVSRQTGRSPSGHYPPCQRPRSAAPSFSAGREWDPWHGDPWAWRPHHQRLWRWRHHHPHRR